MITYLEAMTIIDKCTPIDKAINVALPHASGHRLAEDFVAPFSSPRFNNSAMDGFAFRHHDYLQCQHKLFYFETIHAGEKAARSNKEKVAVAIMTGAPVGNDFDTVVPFEQCQIDRVAGTVSFPAQVSKGQNIRLAGEDITQGQKLLPAGSMITPERLMLIANFGPASLQVKARPRLALISTGDEIKPAGTSLNPNQIYNSSLPFLQAQTERLGLKCSAQHLPDKKKDLLSALEKIIDLASDEPTLILSTGAVSAGQRDFIPEVSEELGLTKMFHKVAVRPGKPVFLARATAKPLYWLGLPGNPISTAVGWHFFARPLLRAWGGIPEARRAEVRLATNVSKPEPLRCFYRAIIRDGLAHVAKNQGSAHLLASSDMNAYIVFPEGISQFSPNTELEAINLI